MKVYRLPFVNGVCKSETHVHALKLIHVDTYGLIWHLVEEGVAEPTYPAVGTHHKSYNAKLAQAFLGAY